MTVSTDDCVEWDGYLHPVTGYATRWANGRNELVHRVAYEEIHGPIPEGLEIDHLCSNRACFNVDHLEAVTHKVNRQRGRNANAEKTHCRQGHALSGANVYYPKRGGRQCRTCARASDARRSLRGDWAVIDIRKP